MNYWFPEPNVRQNQMINRLRLVSSPHVIEIAHPRGNSNTRFRIADLVDRWLGIVSYDGSAPLLLKETKSGWESKQHWSVKHGIQFGQVQFIQIRLKCCHSSKNWKYHHYTYIYIPIILHSHAFKILYFYSHPQRHHYHRRTMLNSTAKLTEHCLCVKTYLSHLAAVL